MNPTTPNPLSSNPSLPPQGLTSVPPVVQPSPSTQPFIAPQQLDQSMPVHSHTSLYSAVLVSLGAAGILFVLVIILIVKTQMMQTPQGSLSQSSSSQMTVQPTPIPSEQAIAQQLAQPTPTPVVIQSVQGLSSIAQTLDSTDLTQISSGLDQNSQDLSGFNQ